MKQRVWQRLWVTVFFAGAVGLVLGGVACSSGKSSGLGKTCAADTDCPADAPLCLPFDANGNGLRFDDRGVNQCTRACGGTARCSKSFQCLRSSWPMDKEAPAGLTVELGDVELCVPLAK